MSSAIFRETACVGKQPFTQKQAQQIATAMRRRKGSNPSAYRCTFCNQWHVGSLAAGKRSKPLREKGGEQ